MRIGVLREIKNIHKFFDNMEKSVKTKDPEKIQRAYMFIKTLVIHMEDGELNPENVTLNLNIERAFMELNDE